MSNNFKSVRIFLGKKVDSRMTADLVDWLNRFDYWYKEKNSITDNHNIHLLQKREVLFSANKLLVNTLPLKDLINSCLQLDLLPSIRISLQECCDFFTELNSIIEQFPSLSIVIDASNSNLAKSPPSLVRSIVENLAAKKHRLVFIGSLPFWLKCGISSSQILGKSVYEIIPDAPHFKRSFWGDYNPCAKRMLFVIDFNGLIYPCIGLLGIPSCCTGTIYQPLSTLWEQMKKHSLNINKLATQGPIISNFPSNLEDMNSICDAHRYSLLNMNSQFKTEKPNIYQS